MHPPKHNHRRGFTLVEIMIVVAIIALLAAIALPNFLRARKRSQATHIMNDLRMLDNAVDQYAADTGRLAGFNPGFADVQNYLKTDTTLYATGADIFGDSYGPFTVDSIPVVPTSAFNALSDVADATFWPPYIVTNDASSAESHAEIVAQDLAAVQSAQADLRTARQTDPGNNQAQVQAARQALRGAEKTYQTALKSN